MDKISAAQAIADSLAGLQDDGISRELFLHSPWHDAEAALGSAVVAFQWRWLPHQEPHSAQSWLHLQFRIPGRDSGACPLSLNQHQVHALEPSIVNSQYWVNEALQTLFCGDGSDA